MARLSSEITGKYRSALFLLSALFEQGPVVAERVTDKIRASHSEGEEPVDFLTLIRGLGQIFKATLDQMVELDTDLVTTNQERAALFDDREEKTAFLGKRIIGLRRLVQGHFIDPDLARLGLKGRTARETVALLRQSELICQRLTRDDVDELLGESLFEPALDMQTYESQVSPAVDALQEALEAFQRAQRRRDELLSRKKQAVKEYDTAFIRVARQFEDLCRLAGLDELAEKVRPSLTRKGEKAIEPEDVPSDAGDDSAPPAEGAAPSEAVTEPEPTTEPETSASHAESSDEPGIQSAAKTPASG